MNPGALIPRRHPEAFGHQKREFMIFATVAGNVGKQAEVKTSAKGKPWITFSIASNRMVDGEKVTTWIGVSGPQEKVAPYLTKGASVVVVGELSTVTKEDKTYLNLYASQIKLMGSKSESDSGQAPPASNDEPVDDLPF